MKFFFKYLFLSLLLVFFFHCKSGKQQKDQIMDGLINDLKGKTLSISDTLFLDENKILKNGILVGNGAVITGDCTNCLQNIELRGSWKNDSLPLKWFTTGANAQRNYSVLCQIIELGKTVVLDKKYPIFAPANASYLTKKAIRIIGNDPKDSGLILKTKHKYRNAYFANESGNNIYLENISIHTEDYLKNIFDDEDYVFAQCQESKVYPNRRPSFDYFTINNCILNGRIHFDYGARPSGISKEQFRKLGIDEITITNSKINRSKSLLTLRSVPYKKVLIEGNSIENLYGPTFFFPISSPKFKNPNDLYTWREELTFKDNIVENKEFVKDLNLGYLAPLVVKGYNCNIIGNTVKNIISFSPKCETYSFYASALNELIVDQNEMYNCFNVYTPGKKIKIHQQNVLVKFKGALNCKVTNNSFVVEKGKLSEALGKKAIDPQTFRMALVGTTVKSYEKENYYIFENNTFKTAYLNDYSTIPRHNFIFKNNTVEIDRMDSPPADYWGEVAYRLDHTLFYMRDKRNDSKIEFVGNTIEVKQMQKNTLKITDNQYSQKEYKELRISQNKIICNGKHSFYQPKAKKRYISE